MGVRRGVWNPVGKGAGEVECPWVEGSAESGYRGKGGAREFGGSVGMKEPGTSRIRRGCNSCVSLTRLERRAGSSDVDGKCGPSPSAERFWPRDGWKDVVAGAGAG